MIYRSRDAAFRGELGAGVMHRAFDGAVLPATEADDIVHVLWGTGARGLRHLWDGTPYFEELDMAGADTSRLVGAPVLDSHDRGSIKRMLGHVLSQEIRGGAGYADLKVSNEHALVLYRAGSLRDVSVGYTIQEVERTGYEDDIPIITVRKWTPFEISLVPVGFDSTAQILRAP